MKTDLNSITEAAQDQILAAISMTQTAILEGIKTVSSSVTDALPAMPNVPGLDKLPNPADGVELSFAFAERLLASQRSFAEQLVAIARPATKPAAKATPKAKA